jgi:outer membrane protein OmpA-like peptidoglycan-associated protein
MNFISTTRKVTFAALLSMSLAACASNVRRVEYPQGTDSQAKVTELRQRLNQFSERQYNLISPGHFENAHESLINAQRQLDRGESSEDVLQHAGEAEAHLQLVEENGKRYEQRLATVTSARRAAMDAGAARTLPKEWASADKEFRSLGSDIEKDKFRTDANRLSRLEARYGDLEVKSLKRNTLGEVRRMIDSAEDRDAQERAPQTLAEAKVKYDSALRAIESNRRNPSGYEPAVQAAWEAARKLSQVVATIEQSGSNEAAAVEIYNQREQLASAQSSLERAQERTQDYEKLQEERQKFASREEMNQKIRELRQQFSENEAEVVQDGNKIILRLKNVQFPTNRADLPKASLATLEKVKEMISTVPAERIVVEGHTDSVGARKVNQELSQKRAETVKEFLVADNTVPENRVEAKGMGEQRPITTNQTKRGRATNRRVDVVIETEETVLL